MCDLFSNSQNTQQKTNQSQSGQSSTQSNIWDQISPFLQQYMQQYSPGNIAQTGTPNSTQTTAAGNQTNVASGASLAPGQTAASNISSSGLTPSQIQSYMSPYISSVVDPTIQAQNIQNQQGLSNLRGNMAARGALGNNTGAEAAYLAGVQPAQEATIGNLYNQGYNTAANTALSSGQLQLSGANALGNLANVGTNANNALYNIGQGLFQTGLTPYSLYSQGVSGLQGLGGLAGSNTQSSGTSTGTSNGTTTSTPSLGSILLGGLGTLMSGFKDGGDVGGIPEMEPFHPHDDMATKVAKGVRAIHKLRREMGGNVPRYDDGGMVPFVPSGTMMMTPFQPTDMAPDPSAPTIGPWQTTVTPASPPQMKGFNTSSAGKNLTNLASNLGSFGMPRYDDGGVVPQRTIQDQADDDAADGYASPPMPVAASAASSDGSVLSGLSKYLPTFSSGVWAGQAPSAMQRFGAALTQVGNGPFAGFGQSILAQQGMRYKDLEAAREAQRLGLEAQQVGMAKEKLPADIALTNAQANLARTNADKQFLLDIEKQKAQFQKDLALSQMQKQYEMVNGILNNSGRPSQNYPTPQSESEVEALPPGTIFKAPDGTLRTR